MNYAKILWAKFTVVSFRPKRWIGAAGPALRGGTCCSGPHNRGKSRSLDCADPLASLTDRLRSGWQGGSSVTVPHSSI